MEAKATQTIGAETGIVHTASNSSPIVHSVLDDTTKLYAYMAHIGSTTFEHVASEIP